MLLKFYDYDHAYWQVWQSVDIEWYSTTLQLYRHSHNNGKCAK